MTYRVPENVAFVDGSDMAQGDVLFLTLLPYGRTVRLEGVGRIIWIIAAEGRDVATEVAELVGQPLEAISDEISSFLGDLLYRQLLTPRDQR